MDHKEFASLGGKTHKKDPNYFKELVRKRKWRPVKELGSKLPVDKQQAD